MSAADRAPDGVTRVRAANPSPLTLDGTNTYVTRGWVVDPGPNDERHREAVLAAAGARLEGIVLTHEHADHAAGAPALARLAGVSVTKPRGGGVVGPFEAIATPGHSADSVCLVTEGICFTGDTRRGRHL
jgi:glyoxylase-like metal-dependent hydrolase (beta-lactamase superfamily II)